MDVTNQTLTQTQQSTAPPPETQAADDASLITSDFEAFLQMLTAQLENQDPLNPLESTDFATQLATFSGVEQQVRTNTLLSDLQSSLSLSGLGQLAGWIGMDARAQMPVNFNGAPVSFAADPPANADRAELVVRSEAGDELQRWSIPLTDEPMEWAGVSPDGTPLPNGTYQLSIESFQEGELIETEDATIFARIDEAFQRGSETWLTLEGGAQLLASDVQGVRAPR